MRRTILMLEHDEDDRYITQSVFNENKYDVTLHFVNNSRELFDFLEASGRSGSALPSLILLNFHTLPATAVDIIRELKERGTYTHIPVVVLCGQVDRTIVSECYAAGASSFIQKPVTAQQTYEKIATFFNYWFSTVALPA